MNKVIFLDRDGTINIDYGYVGKIKEFKFIDGTIEGLKTLSSLGYLLIVVSNQSGVGRGYFSCKDVEKVNKYMIKELQKEGINISKVYYCPHIDKDNCECRKPKLKLFYDAIKEFDIDINNSYAIGDKERDLSICEKENITGILIDSKKNRKYATYNNLLEAAEYIKKNQTSKLKKKEQLLKQIFRFGIVGVISTIIDFVCLYFFRDIIKLPLVLSNTLSFVISVIYNYFASITFVFNVDKNKSKKKTFTIFIIFSSIGLILNDLIVWFVTKKLKIYYLISKVIATIFVMIFNFITRKKFLE